MHVSPPIASFLAREPKEVAERPRNKKLIAVERLFG
jgi:hypothetical protein